MAKKPRLQTRGTAGAMAKQRFRMARLSDHVAYLSAEMNIIRKELVRQSNEINTYTDSLTVLRGNHNKLKAAILKAFQTVDLKFIKAKHAFKYVYGAIWRLEDLLLPKWFSCRSKVSWETPFCGPKCAQIFEQELSQ